jgi:transcriptional regulator with XRE-family HTH domain
MFLKKNDSSEREINSKIAKKLKLIRLELGLSQKDLAYLTAVSIAQIQKYEKGVNRISPGKLYLIAEALNIDINYFYPSNIAINPKITLKSYINQMSLDDTKKVLGELVDNLLGTIPERSKTNFC